MASTFSFIRAKYYFLWSDKILIDFNGSRNKLQGSSCLLATWCIKRTCAGIWWVGDWFICNYYWLLNCGDVNLHTKHLSNFFWFSFLKLSTRLLIWRQWVTKATLSAGHYLNLLIRHWIVDDFSLAKLPCSAHTLILILFSKLDKPNLNFIDSGNQIKYHEGLQINCPQAPGNEYVLQFYMGISITTEILEIK